MIQKYLEPARKFHTRGKFLKNFTFDASSEGVRASSCYVFRAQDQTKEDNEVLFSLNDACFVTLNK